MLSSLELSRLFFTELKSYNGSNFRTLESADLSREDAKVHKAFSSVVTRYFIFVEKHPEISAPEQRILYFQLKIDLLAKYFSEYPDTDTNLLRPFQLELIQHVKDMKGGVLDEPNNAPAV